MYATFRERAGNHKEATEMSEQDREKLPNAGDEESPEDVEAHKLPWKNDEGEDSPDDEVEAHRLPGR
jgi:hypothetical protein